MYTVKELFPTLQGEGAHTGRAAVFVVSRVAIYGVDARKIGLLQSASFATRILSALTVMVVVSSKQPRT